MKILAISSVVILMLSCNQLQKPKTEGNDYKSMPEKIFSFNVSLLDSAKDPVCGMTVGNKSIADTLTYKNKIFGFCSVECKNEFLKNPKHI